MDRHNIMEQTYAAEKAVLGSLVLGGEEALTTARELIDTEDFYEPMHQRLWDIIVGLRLNGDPVDHVTIINACHGDWDSIGGASYFGELTDAGTSYNVGHYVRLVADLSARRKVEALSVTLRAHAHDGTLEDVGKLAQELVSTVTGVEPVKQRLFNELMQTRYAELKEMAEGGGDTGGRRIGFHCIERYIGGVHPGRMYVVAARPSHGKSALGMNIAHFLAHRQKVRVLIISLEMPAVEVVDRFFAMQSETNISCIQEGFNANVHVARAEEAMKEMWHTPLTVLEHERNTVFQIRNAIERFALQTREGEPRPVVVIDYLQLIAGTGKKNQARYAEVGEVSRTLKLAAMDLDVCLIVLAQLSRRAEDTKNAFEKVSLIRESGDIEQDADAVIILTRLGEEEGEKLCSQYDLNHDTGMRVVEVCVGKNRQGKVGKALLDFDGPTQRFYELEKKPKEHVPKDIKPVVKDDDTEEQLF